MNSEAVRRMTPLPPNYGVQVTSWRKTVRIAYYNLRANRKASKKDPVWGLLLLKRFPLSWEITWVEAKRGFGPLLFDLAIELTTPDGGLMMDHRHASEDAHRVWQYYIDQRADVTASPTDAPTASALEWAEKTSLPWQEMPESMRLTKPPVLLATLEAVGKLLRTHP